MSEKEKQTPEEEVLLEGEVQETPAPEEEEKNSLQAELDALKQTSAQQKEQFLRLAAEYENYRRRTAKEKESIWADVKGETVQKFLPVYDNLERALKQETADEAYKKGVEMT